MQIRVNAFKRALQEEHPQIGLWSTLCSNWTAEILAPAGFDWILIDMEHSPNDVGTVLGQLQVYESVPTVPVVRPAWNDSVLVKRILDLGVFNLLFPMIQSAEEAQSAVAATRYPPKGIRGVSLSQRGNRFGRITDYLERVEQELCVLVQIETLAALECIAEIAAVEGVDGIFFGPADLSANMGLLGQPRHPDVWQKLKEGLHRCKRVGKPAGILTGTDADSVRCIRDGFTFVAVGSDAALLTRGADDLLVRIRSAIAD